MSITSNLFQKAGQPIEAIYGSKLNQQIAASHGSLTTVSNDRTLRAKHIVESEITSAMLESEAFIVPVNRLIDVWVARFGNRWIDLETLEGDEFFSNAFKRLKQLGEVEVHFLTDRARYVCRMPEQ